MRAYYIKTFGCQMNVSDAGALAVLLEERGMAPVDDPRRADVAVVVTCTIRLKAEEKAFSELGRLVGLKRRGGQPRLVVAAGCVARQAGEELLRRLPGVDVVLGPNRLARLPELLDERLAGNRPVVDTGDEPLPTGGRLPAASRRVTAFVPIMHGCDNRCSYCIVPSVRGPEKSRDPAAVEEEVRRLVDRGVREVTLLGQNVNSYGKGLTPRITFAALLERLDRTKIGRLRFTTSHPRDFGRDLAEAMRDLPSVCESLHLPVQAGSDRVLADMGRGYSAADFRQRERMLRELVPRAALSTDIIVGFPTEEEEDFEETERLIGESGFSSLFAFKFSSRPGTPAARLEDRVTPAEKDRRLQRVLALQAGQTARLHRERVGTVVEVLAEGPSRTGEGLLTGRTRDNLVVNVPAPLSAVGSFLCVRVTGARPHSLAGVTVETGDCAGGGEDIS